MSKALRVPDYLGHILLAMERVETYVKHLDETGFMNNAMVQDAVIRNIEIVGEASNNILRMDPVFAARHSEVPWQVMYAMRNRVAHAYDRIDIAIVWNTVQHDLPRLRAQISKLLSTIQA